MSGETDAAVLSVGYEQIRAQIEPRPLGRGGQGVVHALAADRTIGPGWPVVYKEYLPQFQDQVDADALRRMAALREEIPAADAEWLYENTAWPAAVVEKDGRPCGFLMRRVPDEFSFDFLSSTRTSTGTRKPANFEFLLNSDDYVAGVGLRLSRRDRLNLLAAVAETLDRLHGLRIVVGDLSPKNLLFAVEPRPRCFVIDCDAMRPADLTVLPQTETPDWSAPTGEAKATRQTDAYKFGLLAIRTMAQTQDERDPSVLARFTAQGDAAIPSPGLDSLARQSLDAAPDARPSPRDWVGPLRAAAVSADARIPVPPPAPGPASRTAAAKSSTGTAKTRSARSGSRSGGRTPNKRTPNNRRRTRRIIYVVCALLAVAFLLIHVFSSQPAANPTSVGLVKIWSPMVADPRAASVAATFDTYFSDLNAQEYSYAFAEIDPTSTYFGTLQTFTQTVSTTSQYDQIVLEDIGPSIDTSDPATTAEVAVQSLQPAGLGPTSDPQETCTDWTLDYQLTRNPNGGYYIYSSTGGFVPCPAN